MSTHNIGFYEDLTKIIFKLSSNIIKYAPYYFCCPMIWALRPGKTLISLGILQKIFGLGGAVGRVSAGTWFIMCHDILKS